MISNFCNFGDIFVIFRKRKFIGKILILSSFDFLSFVVYFVVNIKQLPMKLCSSIVPFNKCVENAKQLCLYELVTSKVRYFLVSK